MPSTAPSPADALVVAAPPAVNLPVAGGGRFPVRRVYCVGRNYAEHAREMGHSGREPPFFFMKPADALVPVADGQTGVIDYPPLTAELHHEVELVVAIGQGGRGLDAEQAGGLVWGYAIGLDMTRRDLQAEMKQAGRPWEVGKAFEQSAPVGPVHPVSRVGPLRRGEITLAVNGQPRQRGDLADLIWSVDETLAALSRAWVLAPGDLVYTGTPAGVGAVERGDLIEAAIEGLGVLRVAVR